ncbi:unnamed protein product [Coregonus sp. 'balchen']|nr:unnamed protein product [Coregonus sp. 'balchen']
MFQPPRLNSDTLQQLTVVVYEAQDKDLTQWFLEKVGGDLTSCRLDLEVLLSLLQHSTHNITVDLRKNRLLEKNISDLLPFLGRVIFKRSSSSFVKSTIRQIYDSRASDCVSSLLRSSDHWINLNSRELDRVDCTALCFTLQDCHQVKVNCCGPQYTGLTGGFLLSVPPVLCWHASADPAMRGTTTTTTTTTAVWMLRSLHYRLDFSCSSSVDLSAQDQEEALTSKALLRQAATLWEGIEEGVLRHAGPLCRALEESWNSYLSHNDITDALTDKILQLVSTNTSIHTVRLFNNRIQDRRPFLTDKRFEIW